MSESYTWFEIGFGSRSRQRIVHWGNLEERKGVCGAKGGDTRIREEPWAEEEWHDPRSDGIWRCVRCEGKWADWHEARTGERPVCGPDGR